MKALCLLLATSLLPGFARAADGASFWGFEGARAAFHGVIWKAPLEDFSEASYAAEVAALLASFEAATGRGLVPGRHGRAGLKIYSNSGAGLQTPLALVRAVILELERRGFAREDLFLVDAREDMLRDAGYLPPLSRMPGLGPYFEGVRVYALNTGTQRSPVWYYESPLPQEFTSPLGRQLLRSPLQLDLQEARKSYLPEILLTGADFWINLPMAVHHPATGLSGALVNASLWNITNATRFFNSPANAPVAVAEIASIPELQASWALNLVSLEGYQHIAGPSFNAHYTASRPELWMSVDPVILDAQLNGLLNEARRARGFGPLPEVPEMLEYAVQLGIGQGAAGAARWRAP